MSLYWKSLAVVVLAVGAWLIVPLSIYFLDSEDTSSQLPLYLLTCSVLLAVIAMYVGDTFRSHATRMAQTGRDLAALYLQVIGLLVAISFVLSYTGK